MYTFLLAFRQAAALGGVLSKMDLSKAVALLRAGDVDAEAIFEVRKGVVRETRRFPGVSYGRWVVWDSGHSKLVSTKNKHLMVLFGWEVAQVKLLKMGLRTNFSDLLDFCQDFTPPEIPGHHMNHAFFVHLGCMGFNENLIILKLVLVVCILLNRS